MLIETIRVQVQPDEGDDLLEALSVRGLASRLVQEEDAVAVEVSPPEERWEIWNLEVVSALEAWLQERNQESIVARTDRHEYVVRAPREPSARVEEPESPVLDLPDVDDTARMVPLAPVVEPAVPVGVLEPPQLHSRRPRAVVVAAAVATAILASAGVVLLVFLLVSLL